MILHLWSDRIVLIASEETIVFPFEHVEEHLTKTIIEWYRKYLPPVLYVINGPWSFTNLRVGALVANLMGTLSKWSLQLMTIGKVELYRYLFLQGILPEFAYVYFWQRKNFWIMNLQTDEKQIVSKINFSDIEEVQKHYAVDRFLSEDFPFFADRNQELQINFIENRIIVSYQWETLDCTDIFLPVQAIEPIYGVEANIG